MADRNASRTTTAAELPRGAVAAPVSATLAGKEPELRKALKGLRRILNTMELEENVGRADPDMLAFARRMISERARRFQFFDGHLFSDPAWDIMLELFVAEIEAREVPVTNLCFTSNVPDTTVLRWIKTLCYEGLVVRQRDKVDKRRVLVQLTRPAADAMRRYMEEQMAAAERMHARNQHDAAPHGEGQLEAGRSGSGYRDAAGMADESICRFEDTPLPGRRFS